MKKGQITIFIILSLVVLIAFGILFSYFSQINDAKNSKQQKILEDENLVRNKLEQRVTSCLNTAASDALSLLGQQGGFYYNNQKVKTPYGNFKLNGINVQKKNKINYFNKNYTIWFKKRNLEKFQKSLVDYSHRHYFKEPIYPCRSPVKSLFSNFDSKRDYDSNKQATCVQNYRLNTKIDSFSEIMNFPGFCKNRIPEGCEKGNCDCVCLKDCDNTVEAELEDYVGKYFDLCFNNFVIDGYKKEDVIFSKKIKSIISLNTLEFEIIEPIKLISETTGSVISLVQPKSDKINLKLSGLFNDGFKRIIGDEFVDATSNLVDRIENLVFFSELKVNKQIFNKDGEKYNLITLTLRGTDGSLNGNPYNFYFVRENRNPVLEFINNKKINSTEFKLKVKAVDPDEDELFFDIYSENNKISKRSSFITKGKDKFTKILNLVAKSGKYTEKLKIKVCDDNSMRYCDFQTIKIIKV